VRRGIVMRACSAVRALGEASCGFGASPRRQHRRGRGGHGRQRRCAPARQREARPAPGDTVGGSIEAQAGQARWCTWAPPPEACASRGRCWRTRAWRRRPSPGRCMCMPRGRRAASTMSTFSGHIEHCFDRQPERTSRHGPGEHLSGTLGAGRACLDQVHDRHCGSV
jgi:hypothetical protein